MVIDLIMNIDDFLVLALFTIAISRLHLKFHYCNQYFLRLTCNEDDSNSDEIA